MTMSDGSASSTSATRIVDAHVHFWDPDVLRYEWLDGEAAWNRRRLPSDIRTQDPGSAMFVFVQADARPDQGREEVRWVQDSRAIVPPDRRHRRLRSARGGRSVRAYLEALSGRAAASVGVRRLLQSEDESFFQDRRSTTAWTPSRQRTHVRRVRPPPSAGRADRTRRAASRASRSCSITSASRRWRTASPARPAAMGAAHPVTGGHAECRGQALRAPGRGARPGLLARRLPPMARGSARRLRVQPLDVRERLARVRERTSLRIRRMEGGGDGLGGIGRMSARDDVLWRTASRVLRTRIGGRAMKRVASVIGLPAGEPRGVRAPPRGRLAGGPRAADGEQRPQLLDLPARRAAVLVLRVHRRRLRRRHGGDRRRPGDPALVGRSRAAAAAPSRSGGRRVVEDAPRGLPPRLNRLRPDLLGLPPSAFRPIDSQTTHD